MFEKNTIQLVQEAIVQRCTYGARCALLGLAVAAVVQIAADLTCFYVEGEWQAVWRGRVLMAIIAGIAVAAAQAIHGRTQESDALVNAFVRMCAMEKNKADRFDSAQLLIDLKRHARFVDKGFKVIFIIPLVVMIGGWLLLIICTLEQGCIPLGLLYAFAGLVSLWMFFNFALVEQIDLHEKETRLKISMESLHIEYAYLPYTGATMQTDIDADNAIHTDIVQHFARKRKLDKETLITALAKHRYIPSVRRVDDAHRYAHSLAKAVNQDGRVPNGESVPTARISVDSMILMRDERLALYNKLLETRFSILAARLRTMLDDGAQPADITEHILSWYTVPGTAPAQSAPVAQPASLDQ